MQVVAATCTGCGDPRLREFAFRMVVIDEASQATEPSTLVPLVKGGLASPHKKDELAMLL